MTVASQVKQTLATLKSSRAVLKAYSLQANLGEAKLIFEEAAGETERIITEIEERLKALEFEEPQYKGL